MNRDLAPTPEAVFAMFYWSSHYAKSHLGSMGFWDSLAKQEKNFCKRAIREIKKSLLNDLEDTKTALEYYADPKTYSFDKEGVQEFMESGNEIATNALVEFTRCFLQQEKETP